MRKYLQRRRQSKGFGYGDGQQLDSTERWVCMPYRSMLGVGELACLEMTMIGKPYAGELPVRFDEGEHDFVLPTILYGHEAGNGGYGQG